MERCFSKIHNSKVFEKFPEGYDISSQRKQFHVGEKIGDDHET